MAGWIKVREHIWADEHGTPILRHTKFLCPDGGVRFPWETRIDFGNGIARWFKGIDPSITPPLLYGLPMFVAADRDERAFIVEGEADADAAKAHGLVAVTAGAAGAFRREHALLFRGWRGCVTICRDNDLPGAWGAVKAYDALRAVGIPAGRLGVVRGRVRDKGADLRDHLDAGFSIEQLVIEPIATVRSLASRANGESFARAGYRDWVVVSPDEVADIENWKPITS